MVQGVKTQKAVQINVTLTGRIVPWLREVETTIILSNVAEHQICKNKRVDFGVQCKVIISELVQGV